MRSVPRSRFLSQANASVFWALALCVAGVRAQGPAEPDGPALQLRPSLRLSETLSPESRQAPTFVFGNRVSGQPDVATTIDGQAQLRRPGLAIRADRIDLEALRQRITTQGQVRIQSSGNVFIGTALDLSLETFEGFFSQPQFMFRGGANGQAKRIDFLGEQRLVAREASYTTCERDNEASWKPAWEFRAERLYFDLDAEVGEAYKPMLRFHDVPVLAWAGSISFPLSEKRKSGLLPPSYALDTTSGFSLTLPLYLDIAPHRDATLTPTVMSKRGVDLGAEFRYLERQDRGTLRLNVLPNDRLTQQERWSYGFQHEGSRAAALAGGNLSYALNLNRVSDDNYWRDFPRQNKALTQRLLPNDTRLSWSRDHWFLGLRTLAWQTLQATDSVITPPYDRLPQLTGRYGQTDVPVTGLGGLDWAIDSEFTRFQATRALTSQTNGERLVARAQLSRPWMRPAGFVVPKLQLHATQYTFDETWKGSASASRLVPTFSLDSGLQFERDARFFGRSFVQTLEPRAFYVHTPYRDQSRLPNYDSAENSFSFASLFAENSFIGQDRIADAQLLTLGLISRLLQPDSGAESVRLGVAQRIRFADQRVTLDGSPPPVNAEKLSDILLGGTLNWNSEWALNLNTQYSPKLGESQRTTLSGRYSPSLYRVLSASYKRQRPLTPTDAGSQQVDLGWQWPINDLWGELGQDLGPGRGQGGRRWYSVGRLNYSMTDGKLVDSVVGIEYDGCCWIGRAVLQRSTRGTTSTNTQLMFQLEFVGFSRIGNNPLSTLRTQIPRYQLLRDQVSLPSRFSNYE
jgi:LPS-assembly protein